MNQSLMRSFRFWVWVALASLTLFSSNCEPTQEYPSLKIYKAVCTCNHVNYQWRGPKRATRREAERDMENHNGSAPREHCARVEEEYTDNLIPHMEVER